MSDAPRIDRPESGFYRTRLVKDGAWVAARIWRPCSCTVNGGDSQAEHDWRDTCDRYPRLRCEVDGKDRDPVLAWPSLAGRAISESEFQYLNDTADWARKYAPTDPAATPGRAINLGEMPSLF